jgi:hypothetical protein
MDLIQNNKINVVHCPACGLSEMPAFPLFATNANKTIAVWYKPLPDRNMDSDVALYRKHFGEDSFYAKDPRIKDWKEFKRCLAQLNNGPDVPYTLEDLSKLNRGML